jgi:hypothetical protein
MICIIWKLHDRRVWDVLIEDCPLFLLSLLRLLICGFLDFMQASTSMFEAKSEGILSWCADDNFILEDDLAPDFEVRCINFVNCFVLGNTDLL